MSGGATGCGEHSPLRRGAAGARCAAAEERGGPAAGTAVPRVQLLPQRRSGIRGATGTLRHGACRTPVGPASCRRCTDPPHRAGPPSMRRGEPGGVVVSVGEGLHDRVERLGVDRARAAGRDCGWRGRGRRRSDSSASASPRWHLRVRQPSVRHAREGMWAVGGCSRQDAGDPRQTAEEEGPDAAWMRRVRAHGSVAFRATLRSTRPACS